MKNKREKLSALLLIIAALAGLNAQQAIPSTGGNASGSGGSVSYSVGQVFYSDQAGLNGSVAPGVQQPYEISVVAGKEEPSGITLQCSAYPNPVKDLLILRIEGNDPVRLSAALIDATGKPVRNVKIRGSETSLAMSNLSAATYYLNLYKGSLLVKSFVIIKN